MSTVYPKFDAGPITFTAEETVTGGQLVTVGANPRTIKPAGADDARVVGVALKDASPAGPIKHTAVACTPAQIAVAVTGEVAAGDLVKAGAAGAVTKAAEEDAFDIVVGRVIETLADGYVSIRLYV